MLNCLASLAMSTSIFKALPRKLNIKIHSPSILYLAFYSSSVYSSDVMDTGILEHLSSLVQDYIEGLT